MRTCRFRCGRRNTRRPAQHLNLLFQLLRQIVILRLDSDILHRLAARTAANQLTKLPWQGNRRSRAPAVHTSSSLIFSAVISLPVLSLGTATTAAALPPRTPPRAPPNSAQKRPKICVCTQLLSMCTHGDEVWRVHVRPERCLGHRPAPPARPSCSL